MLFVPASIATTLAQDSEIPAWIKNTAGWWATDAISETEFVNAIEFLVKENIIQVNASQASETSQGVPGWVKNTAGWWATDAISEEEFVNAIAYLIKVGIISIESSTSPELIAEMWVNGDIDDDEFLANVERLIEKGIITIRSDSITKTSQLPDWLVNNAGWWAARILTNSDYAFDPEYVKERIFPCDDDSVAWTCIEVTYNSHGLRGNELEKEKPENTYRIFTVGGSTTFGVGAQDSETWPAHLQQIINEKIMGKKIEVINAGIEAASTEQEYILIKNKLLYFDPDLIIMYDGINDFSQSETKKTIQNWKSACKLGNQEGYDTIIIVQPVSITGQRVLTEQETENSISNLQYLEKSQQYVNAFKDLDYVCSKTFDFRSIFDYVQEPIFWDSGHTMSFGNKIIAENVFSVIAPNFGKTYSTIHSLHTEKNEPSIVYAVGSDLSNRNFDNLNLKNAVFDKADLSNTSFKNTNIDGARFVFANLSNSNLLDRTDLSNINLAGTDLSKESLKGKNLSGTILTGSNLSDSDLRDADMSGTVLTKTNLTGTILKGVDLSGIDFTGAVLTRTDLSNAILIDIDLSSMELTETILIDANLSNVDFQYTSFDNTNMKNANLSGAKLIQVDLTKIKNKSLAGADLSSTTFAHSNLSGIDLSDANLVDTNFWKSDLSGQDFTLVSNSYIDGAQFIESNLSNSNFQNVNLSPTEIFFKLFKNKAYLKNSVYDSLSKELFGEFQSNTIFVLSSEIRGNDLAVNFVHFNSFSWANLENANFKNANLKFADFYQANLTNADLSGANLRNAILVGTDLSNANLDGANLDGANLDGANLEGANLDGALYNENTVLKCKNHPICVSG